MQEEYSTSIEFSNKQMALIVIKVMIDGAIKTGRATILFKEKTFGVKWDDEEKPNLDKSLKKQIKSECINKALKQRGGF